MKNAEEHVMKTQQHETMLRGLLAGDRDISCSSKRVFFDYLKAVAAYGEVGDARREMIAELETAESKDLFRSLQTECPWVTDVFMYGILAGEEAQSAAKRELLAHYAGFPETVEEAERALALDRAKMTEGALARQSDSARQAIAEIRSALDGGGWIGSAERLSEVRWCLKYLPDAESERHTRMVLDALTRKCEEGGAADAFSRFRGKYSSLPVALGMESAYAGLCKAPFDGTDLREYFVRNKCIWFAASDAYQAALTKALERCSEIALSDKASEWRLRGEVGILCRPADIRNVLALRSVPEGLKERIANGIVGVELLWALSRESASRMNARGSGAIPAFHLAGRATRDGRAIESSSDALYSVDQALDEMVMRAHCQLSAAREMEGMTVVTYEPFREYMEGEFNAKHLTALIDNAVANKKYLVTRPKGALPIVTVSIDVPLNQNDDEEGAAALIDVIPGSGTDLPDDYANFVSAVTKRYAPTMWRYLRLVEWGISASDIKRLRETEMAELADKYAPGDQVSKGDALKMVGARTPHLVERERASLLKALEGVNGPDYQEMAKRLRKALKK